MADTLEYFDVERGIGIEELVQIIPSNGPPGASGDSTTVPKGSFALDYVNGDVYRKKLDGSGTDKWSKLIGADEVLTDISWREPAAAHDAAADPIPTGLGATDTRDGVTINEGDRVLFSEITAGDGPNVYIFTAESAPAAGDGFYTEDSNDETPGDRLTVLDGTAGNVGVWTLNSSNVWVLSEKPTDEKELTYLRNFIGKTVLGDLSATEPAYSSNNYVADGSAAGDDLTDAVGKIDAGLGTKIALPNTQWEVIKDSATNTVNDNLRAIDGALADLGGASELNGVSGAQVLDTVGADKACVVEWIIYARNGANVRSWTVTATHDGSEVAGASNTDRAVRVRLVLGTLDASVSISTTGSYPNQTIDLDVSSTPTVDWRATRRIVKF